MVRERLNVVYITNVAKVRDKLRALEAKARKESNVAVVVGYNAEYAVYVHENLEMRHREGKQAKYLEQPAREKQGEIADIVRNVTKKTGSLLAGLLMGGQFLQRASQEIVPVKTGNLKGSAFTEKE